MKPALRRLSTALGLAALAAAYASAFPGLAVWLGPGLALIVEVIVLVVLGVLGLDLLEDVVAECDVLDPPMAALIGLVAVTAAQLSLASGAAIAGWPVWWMWLPVAASAPATAIVAFWLWDRDERADARFWTGARRPDPDLLPSDQRAVLERLAVDGPLSILGETPPEVGAEAWERALATLEEYGWVRPGPNPGLTEQGRAALAHDRLRRYELVTNAMDAVLRHL